MNWEVGVDGIVPGKSLVLAKPRVPGRHISKRWQPTGQMADGTLSRRLGEAVISPESSTDIEEVSQESSYLRLA